MRILLIVNTLPPDDLSGAGEQVLQLAHGLRDVGHEVMILGRGAGGVPGPKVLFPIAVLPAAVIRLRKLRPHVVQVHESDGGLAVLLLRLVRPLFRPRPRLTALQQVSYRQEFHAVRPLIARMSDGTTSVVARPTAAERRFRYLRAPLQMILGRLTAELVDQVIAPTRTTAEEIERDYRVGSVAVVPNVTGESADPEEGSVELTGKPGYLLYIGRLRIRKGVEILLAALAELRRRGVSVELVIAGDGERRQRLEARARELNVAEGVRFLGRCDASAVRSLLREARVVVVPSIYEGMPLVILEAMAAGVAVVAARISGIPEVVRDPDTGWLVDPADVQQLSDALAAACQDPAETTRRGVAGRRRQRESFTPQRAAEAWLRLTEKGSP